MPYYNDDILNIIKDKLESYNYICDAIADNLGHRCLVSLYRYGMKIPLCYIKYIDKTDLFLITSRDANYHVLIDEQITNKIVETVSCIKDDYYR